MSVRYHPTVNNYYNPDSRRKNNLFLHYNQPAYQRIRGIETMPSFPMVSSLEFTNQCNLDCLFCARAVMTRPRGYMAPALFRKILSEYREHRTFVKVNGYGENLLHPQSLEFISEIKEGNGLYFTSNCTMLDDAACDVFVQRGVDVLQVSFQSVSPEGYEKERRRAKYEHVIANVRRMIRRRGDGPYPFIHLSTTLLDEPAGAIEEFIEMGFRLGVDSVGIGRTDYDRVIDEMITDDDRRRQIQEMRRRQTLAKVADHSYLYKYLDINWDGIAVSSFFDFDEFVPVGDLNRESLYEVWNSSEVLNALRVLERHQLLNKMKVFDTFYHAWHVGNAAYNLRGGNVQVA
jgi:MoaA/NifB/PqqE/SkfB family radical SAM enzyme